MLRRPIPGPTLLLALGLATAAAQAQPAPQPVADFSAGPGNGSYSFASWTPRSLPELLRGPAGAPVQAVTGHLFLPPLKPGEKVPAIVFVHGSGGVYSAMLEHWPRLFNAQGWAFLALDAFGPRGVQGTADDQSQLPVTAETADAFAALRLLSTHPAVDATRIAIIGASRGGITATRTAMARVLAAQQLPGGLRFAAHVPLYAGGCVGATRARVKPGVFGPAPMLWVHGDADDYTAMAPCQDYARRIGEAGTPTEFVAIPGAHHKFDADDTRRITLRQAQRTREDCPLETDVETLQVFDRVSGQRVQGEAFREALKQCGAQGATVEGNRAAREQAGQAMLGFFRKVFAR